MQQPQVFAYYQPGLYNQDGGGTTTHPAAAAAGWQLDNAKNNQYPPQWDNSGGYHVTGGNQYGAQQVQGGGGQNRVQVPPQPQTPQQPPPTSTPPGIHGDMNKQSLMQNQSAQFNLVSRLPNQENFKRKLQNITSSLQKIVECPICLDTIKVPFKTCSIGHGVCNSCCGKLEKCPTCQGTFTAENLICLKNILEALPRLCRYSDDGCEEVVEPGDDHEEFCGYRPIGCQEDGCEVKMPLIKLMDHYQTSHPKRCTLKEIDENLTWPDFNPKNFCTDIIPVLLFKNIFWLSLTNDDAKKQLKVSFQATPIGKLKNNYFARVKFKNGDFVYTYTIKASVSSFCETEEESNEEEDNDLDVNEEYCMVIPQSALHKLVNKKGNLEYNVRFFEEVN